MSLGHFAAGLRAFFEGLWGERIDYYALHPGTVVKQNDDKTLDVLCDPRPDGTESPLGGIASVPIEIGIPGAVVEVNKGTRVLVGFRGGNPELRYAALTGAANVKSISWQSGEEFKCLAGKHTFDEAGRAGARLADLVAIGGGLLAKPAPLVAPCVIHLLTPIAPVTAPVPFAGLALTAITPPPPALTPGMSVLAAIQFGPKPLVGAVTTAKTTFKF